MKDEGEGKPPEQGTAGPQLGETLDAPVYEPPKQQVSAVTVAVITVVVAICIYLLIQAGPCSIRAREVYNKDKVLVYSIQIACENYRLNSGQYPWLKPSEVTGTTEIRGRDVYVELRGLAGPKTRIKLDYLGEVRKEFLKNGALVDSWGHEILFRVDPKTGKPVIWSCGENGIDETNDGESPDPAKYPKGYYWFGKGDTGDDISTL
jgi:hypothetical protein